MRWDDLNSLYNGYYPFGYAFVIGRFPYPYAMQLAYALNALLAGLFTASVSSLIAVKRSLPVTLLALAVSIFEPLVFRYANTPGPDIGTAAFPAFAVYLLWKDEFAGQDKPASAFFPLLIGASLGLGFLWRTHVIALAGMILLLAVFLRLLPSFSANAWMIAAFLFMVGIQVFVDVSSGHQPFETNQSFNIYKSLYGVNWTRPPTPEEIEQFSIWREILKKPQFVFRAMLPYFLYLLSFAAPAALCFLIAPKGPIRKFSVFAFVSMLIYAAPLSFGDSPRAPVPMLGLYLLSLVLIFWSLTERARALTHPVRWAHPLITLVLLALVSQPVYEWAHDGRSFVRRNRASHDVFVEVQYILVSHGMKSADEVFSNKYQLYMPSRIPYLPRQFSSWSEDWFWGFSDQYPPLPNDSWESFRKACLNQGVKFLVLSRTAGDQGDFLEQIYKNRFDKDKMGIEYIGSQVNMRIYRIIP